MCIRDSRSPLHYHLGPLTPNQMPGHLQTPGQNYLEMGNLRNSQNQTPLQYGKNFKMFESYQPNSQLFEPDFGYENPYDNNMGNQANIFDEEGSSLQQMWCDNKQKSGYLQQEYEGGSDFLQNKKIKQEATGNSPSFYSKHLTKQELSLIHI
eukprot:TRINITY_DN17541_c0_g2_i1.p3 TRINITY_DN17541_c0_g2~~TRINITY_DN17541_c0_g2_i1.p3  ORF type:complete len:163 (+),score=20.36 TRINITY_DN17541_c0_g2_i1:36-491(+)